MMPEPVAQGVLVIDKPAGPTSHDLVARARRILRVKVGHAGTLDPAATGVLPLLLGPATRLMRFFLHHDKEYLAELELGKTTDTYDRQGRVLREAPVPQLSDSEVRIVLHRFTGEVEQLPPLFSAVKVKGERLYRAARRNETVERPRRRIQIHELELLGRQGSVWQLRIHCSSGTYIRSLVHDIGEQLGCGAYLRQLRRTRSGNFTLSRAISPEEIAERWPEAVIPLEDLLLDWPRVDLDEPSLERIRHGNFMKRPAGLQSEHCRLFYGERLVALGRAQGETLRPFLVLV